MCLFEKEYLEKGRLESGEVRGFEYEIVHNDTGYRCGYIKVLPGHPWFAKDYDDISADVHGGLTYANYGIACAGEHDEKAEWWVGFDCMHVHDGPDESLYPKDGEHGAARIKAIIPDYFEKSYNTIKDTPYVRAECASLAQQAHDAALSAWAAGGA